MARSRKTNWAIWHYGNPNGRSCGDIHAARVRRRRYRARELCRRSRQDPGCADDYDSRRHVLLTDEDDWFYHDASEATLMELLDWVEAQLAPSRFRLFEVCLLDFEPFILKVAA